MSPPGSNRAASRSTACSRWHPTSRSAGSSRAASAGRAVARGSRSSCRSSKFCCTCTRAKESSVTEEADFIIVGGGSAGCVLAARLSENPAHRVVLPEAGGEGRDFLVNMPAGTAKLMGHKAFDWCLPTEPDPTIDGRPVQWAAGKALARSEEHTSELPSPMRSAYAVFCLKKKK